MYHLALYNVSMEKKKIDIMKLVEMDVECFDPVLTKRNAEIFACRYVDKMTYEKIGKKFNLSRERVRSMLWYKEIIHRGVFKHNMKKSDFMTQHKYPVYPK